MRWIINVFLLALIIFSCNFKKGPTDLKEYGYLGKVKKVKLERYGDLNKDGEDWILDQNNIIFKREITFDKKGKAVKFKNYYKKNDNNWLREETSKMHFKNGLKQWYEIIDENGGIVEKVKFIWSNNNNYREIAERNSGIRIESYSKTNRDYRDLTGNYKYFKNDTLIISESYSNNLNSRGEILSSEFVDHIKKTSYTVIRKNLEKDNQGNSIKFVLFFEDTKNVKWLEVREFEYYE